jgi:hypothetical protein
MNDHVIELINQLDENLTVIRTLSGHCQLIEAATVLRQTSMLSRSSLPLGPNPATTSGLIVTFGDDV